MQKKIFSLFLSVLLVFSLSVSVFGADSTITLTGTDGDTYQAYQIFSATSTIVGGDELIGYTLNSDFEGFFTPTRLGSYPSAVDYVKAQSDASDAAALANALMDYVIAEDLTPTAEGTTTLDVNKGYYLIIEKDNTVGARSLAMLEVTTKAHSVAVKSSTPTLTLKVLDDDSSTYIDIADTAINETLKFKLTGSVTNMKGYTNYTYTIHNTLEEGLTYDDIESVTYYDGSSNPVTPVGVTYTVEDKGNGQFDIKFVGMKNAANSNVASVEVVYTATTNDDIVYGNDGNLASAYLTYSKDPYDLSLTENTVVDNVIVYSYTMDIHKIDATTDAFLSGATFSIYSDSGATNLVSLLATGEDDTYKVVPSGTAGAVTQVSTDDTGIIYIEGLDATTWYLKEITPPVGYNALISVLSVNITADYDGKDDNFALMDRTGLATIGSNYQTTETGAKIVVENSVGGTLPQMGGTGTTMFKMAGLSFALIGVAVLGTCYLVVSKKKNNQ